MLPPLKTIAMKERVSMLFIERGQIDVLDGAFVVIDKSGVRTQVTQGIEDGNAGVPRMRGDEPD